MKRIVFLALFCCILTPFVNAQSVVAKREFNNTLNAYFDTKNALAKDDVALAGAEAKKLLAVINAFPVKTLSETQQAAWKTQGEELKKFTTPIVAEKELKAQRKNFEYVSSAMLKLAKVINLNNSAIYVQYCPMVKRYWLNEVEAVQNPFYGSKMYDCGEVTETIAKK